MQRRRGGRDPFFYFHDPFAVFGGIGCFVGIGGSRDPRVCCLVFWGEGIHLMTLPSETFLETCMNQASSV